MPVQVRLWAPQSANVRRHGQVVRQKPAKLLPPVRIWVSPPSLTGLGCVIYFLLLSCCYVGVLILGMELKRTLKMPMNGLKIRLIKVLAGWKKKLLINSLGRWLSGRKRRS